MPNHKPAPLRALHIDTLDQLEAELTRLETAAREGTLRRSGNWSLGQAAQHLAKFFHGALSGFQGSAPRPVRLIARTLFLSKALGRQPMPSGLRLPKRAAHLLPDPEISDHDGLAQLRAEIDRLRRGERFTHPSPLFGKLTHEQWMTIQLKHAALHLGFLEPGASH